MRVLMLSKACVIGAYQRKLEEMAALPDVTLRVLVPPSWRDPARGELRLERAHVTGYDLRVTPIRFNGSFHLHHYPQFGREVRAFRPDIVHIDEEPYNLATWHALWHARRAGARPLFFSWQNIARRYPLPFRLGERWVLRSVSYALVGTQSAADVWRAKGYAGPLAIIPQFGVDPDVFAPAERPREREPFVVGFVGRLVEEKGGAILLDALARLDGAWRLDVIGEGPQRAALTDQARRLGIADRVTFLGPREDVPRILLGADLLIHPAYHENTGTVLVEALVAGLPAIASAVCGYAHYIDEAQAGWIVPEPFDQRVFNRLVRDALENDQLREFGKRGIAFAQTEDLHGMVEAAVETIETVASARAGR